MLAFALFAAAVNLVPQDPSAWTTWSARPEVAPRADIVSAAGPVLRLRATNFASYGKWMAAVPGIQGGRNYRFEVQYRPEKIADEGVSVAVVLSWSTAEGKQLQRDYVDRVTPAADGWRTASRTLRSPDAAHAVSVELGLRWTASGTVLWKNAALSETAAPPPRKVRIVTTRISPPPGATVEKNVQFMAETFDRAAQHKPDLVLFTENFVDRGVGRKLAETAQTVPGPATRVLSGKARQYKAWVATSLHEVDNGTFYNTAVLIDREGRIAGKYRKTHLPLEEGERGIAPGSEYPVFDTDFGRVGMLVCWDNWFPEPARIMRLKGAEVLLLPIAGDGVPGHWDIISRARAIDNAVFLVASSGLRGTASRIVDPNGKVLAETDDGIAAAEIDLGDETRVRWLSVGPGDGEAKSLYIKERRPDTYGPLSVPHP